MDLGRARYRQAHKLPPRRWELALFCIALVVTLAVVVVSLDAMAFLPVKR